MSEFFRGLHYFALTPGAVQGLPSMLGAGPWTPIQDTPYLRQAYLTSGYDRPPDRIRTRNCVSRIRYGVG